MTSRELRTQRRAAERKANKLEEKQQGTAALSSSYLPAVVEPIPADDNPAPTRRAAINRANAQFSTGPTTPTGKLASSRNSLKHGLASGEIIIPGEDRAAFEALLDDLRTEHQPANVTEDLLVKELAQSHWLSQRAIRLQNDCFAGAAVDEKRLALYLRYQSTHQRSFHKALTGLMRLQKERRKADLTQTKVRSGFVPQHATPPPSPVGFVSQTAQMEADLEDSEGIVGTSQAA